ncbi:hypothetical protein ACFX2I_026793 [Malus domestica]
MDKNIVISESESRAIASQKLGGLGTFLRKCLFSVVSVGPIPEHIAFIMDGNRRYAKRRNLPVGEGHKAGFLSLMSILRYCYELGVKYVTVYAFSIDNFKRRPDEVKTLMDLLQEKIEGLLEKESIVNQFGIRVYFIGNLKLLNESVRVAAEKAMKATANNSKAVLLICVAYTSCDEIVHAVEESCNVKKSEIRAQINGTKGGCNGGIDGEAGLDTSEACNEKVEGEEKENARVKHVEKGEGEFLENEKQLPVVKVVDVEKHLYMSVAPDPDILIRTSGETRLSNFLLWQTSNCPLYSPAALWPDLGMWHLVWVILNFQRNHYYLEKKRKQIVLQVLHAKTAMALALRFDIVLLPVLLSALLLTKAASTSHHHHDRHHHHLKSLHFTLFQHETINRTGYIVVNGVTGPGVSQTTTPFGTVFVFQDPMTVTANRSSKAVGIAQGTSVTSSLDGLQSISVAKITLRLKNHSGSVSIVGGTHNVKPADHPVVGGTGDFLFVQGYVTSSPVDLRGLTVVYKIAFHLYWPPYATQAS